ncbi:uncharacterized protein EKO05_0006914 [Ascochyta rabiei]|uniref:uncharacterized protein n=1 Tax=Didymella rabiei TaxID=5454 RepID=UPI0021FAB052|nr:uncharacterized protein EKO05_0006914 [Ascochyta rabiei]UPX16517.1 hypothetical protein EKO05_0006914 [Ascochyta rabiei]
MFRARAPRHSVACWDATSKRRRDQLSFFLLWCSRLAEIGYSAGLEPIFLSNVTATDLYGCNRSCGKCGMSSALTADIAGIESTLSLRFGV